MLHPVAVPHPGGHAVLADPAGVARLFLDRRAPPARVLPGRLPHEPHPQPGGVRARLLLLQALAVPAAEPRAHGAGARPGRAPEAGVHREARRARQGAVRHRRAQELQSNRRARPLPARGAHEAALVPAQGARGRPGAGQQRRHGQGARPTATLDTFKQSLYSICVSRS